MSLKDEVEKVLSGGGQAVNRPDYHNLSEFYEDMKAKGAVLRKKYDLPTLDTVGRSLHSPSITTPGRKSLTEPGRTVK